jgi:hypothetical protein
MIQSNSNVKHVMPDARKCRACLLAAAAVVVVCDISSAQAQWSWLNKNIPAYGEEPIRTAKNVRLGIVSWIYDFGDGDLSPAARAEYVAPRFDLYFHDTTYWDPASTAAIRAHNPAVAQFLGAWPTLANERSYMYFGAVGGYNAATMSNMVLRTSGGVEVPSQLWDFGDTHYMDIGNPAWVAYFRTKIMTEMARFGSDGVVMDGTPMDGIYYLNIPGYSPLANYSNATQVNNAIFSFFDTLRSPHIFLTMDDRPAPYYSDHYDAVWGEDWMGYDSTVPFGFNNVAKWNQAVSDLSRISAEERPYIAQGWYHAGDRDELEYLVGSYLLGKESNSATFQPMPVGHPELPPDAPYDLSSYWVGVYEAELNNYPEIFDVRLGDAIAERVSIATNLWTRQFEDGQVYVNASLSTQQIVTLTAPMYDIDGNLRTQITLAPRSGAILSEFGPGDFNRDGSVDAADYSVWRDGLGGAYTQADYNVWSSAFGQPTGSGSVAIPEPTTVALLAMVMAGAVLQRLASVTRIVQKTRG